MERTTAWNEHARMGLAIPAHTRGGVLDFVGVLVRRVFVGNRPAEPLLDFV
jgi:hypothetical protein